MPLNIVDIKGQRIPPAKWAPEQRQSWVRQVLNEARENHQINRPVGIEALAEAEKIAKGNEVLLQEIADVRAITSRPLPVRDPAP